MALLIFEMDVDVASASGDPPTFYWSVLREPSLVFPSPLVFSLVFPVLPWPSMAFLGAPWCFSHMKTLSWGSFRTTGRGRGWGGRARRALNKLKAHRLHKEL